MIKLRLTLLAALFIFILFGCGQAPTTVTANPAIFRSISGQPGRETDAQVTLDKFRAYVLVNASRIDVTFVQSEEEQESDCHGFAACTSAEVNGYQIDTFWPDNWYIGHPYMLAHELCHAWFLQTGEGGDPNHTHTECFARPPYQGVEGQYQSYPEEVGMAWEAALDVKAELP